MLNNNYNRHRQTQRSSLILMTLLAVVGIITVAFSKKMNEQMTHTNIQLQLGNELSSLNRADAWLNSTPLNPKDLRGKVVLVDFWTYTCINWRRQLPYVRAWAAKYKKYGLEVIGVHTPEFAFEQNIDNVRWAVKNMGIDYPVAIDNNYAVWNGFNNHYWPALYFFDTRGNLRHTQFGEGEYEESEKIIQQLLKESGASGINDELVLVDPSGYEVQADWNTLRSPENYLGYDRANDFVSLNGKKSGKPFAYTAASQLSLNQWSLSGNWTRKTNEIVLNESNGRILYRFQARDLHLVMGPAKQGTTIKFHVLINGKAPGEAHGTDIDSGGNGTITEQRMYHLIRQQEHVGDQLFEIEFFESGVEVFVFTFG